MTGKSGSPSPETGSTVEGSFLVDSHVHLHRAFDPEELLDAAVENFTRNAAQPDEGPTSRSHGVLVLTEGVRDLGLGRFLDETGSGRPLTRWALHPCDDGISTWAVRTGGARVLLLSGRQVVTRERLEVLIIGSADPFPDGRPFRETLAACTAGPGIPAVPWGFGKWWMRRGRLLREALAATDPAAVFLSDNGGRPIGTPTPPLMGWAIRRGHGILAGSDPLPLAWQVSRAGSYGNVVQGRVDRNAPGRDLVALIRGLSGAVPTFGRRDAPIAFVRAQTGIRLPRR